MEQMNSLQGKRVVLSGGTTGLGRAIALTLAAQGARVLTFGRHQEPLDAVLAEIKQAGGEAYGLVADMAKEADIAKVFAAADQQLGGVDIVINNAGLPANSVLDTEFAYLEQVIQVNLVAYMLCSLEAIKRMQKQQSGHIINIGSLCVKVLDNGADLYVATKTGVEGFNEAIRKKVVPDNIKVSLINPGAMASDMVRESLEEQSAMQAKGEMLNPQHVAEAVAFCLKQPDQVDITELVIRPHQQSRL